MRKVYPKQEEEVKGVPLEDVAKRELDSAHRAKDPSKNYASDTFHYASIGIDSDQHPIIFSLAVPSQIVFECKNCGYVKVFDV